MTHKIYDMAFSKVYSMLLAKAERRGRTRSEVNQITAWLTGYSEEAIEALLLSDTTYGDFFRQAPEWHPDRDKIRGKVCGVTIQEIADPLMKSIRQLDKLVDDLYKGKSLERVIGGSGE